MPKPTDLLQGTLDLLILKSIAREPLHGWGIAKRIQLHRRPPSGRTLLPAGFRVDRFLATTGLHRRFRSERPGLPFARSIGIHVRPVIQFGGHQQAAGVTLSSDRLEEFRCRFAALAAKRITGEMLHKCVSVDAEVCFGELPDETARDVLSLGPLGHGNPTPLLVFTAGYGRKSETIAWRKAFQSSAFSV
jgi:hypothetical protein